MLLLLLKAPTNNSDPLVPTRLTSWTLSSSTDLYLTISCLSTGLKPVISRRSQVAPNRTLSLSAFSARSGSIFNASGAIAAKIRCNSSVISSEQYLRLQSGRTGIPLEYLQGCIQLDTLSKIHINTYPELLRNFGSGLVAKLPIRTGSNGVERSWEEFQTDTLRRLNDWYS